MTYQLSSIARLAFCLKKIGAQAVWILALFLMLASLPRHAYAQNNNSQFVSQSVPAVMTAGQSYSVSVTMKNSGKNTWTAPGRYRLGAINPQDGTIWSPDSRAYLDQTTTVASGQSYTFLFNVTAPTAPGTYNFQRKMLLEFVEWFGVATPNVQVVVNPQPPNQAQFVSQSVPTTMVAGNVYNVSVTFKNIGTSTWDTARAFKLGGQNPQDNVVWRDRVELAAPVAPGQDAVFSFAVKAPATKGSYNFQWRMLRELVEWFGSFSPNVVIAVSDGLPPPATPPPGGTSPTGSTTYFHNDVAGTPLMASDAAGNVVWKEHYRPYGEKINQQLNSANKLWFAGKPYDQNTGLSYMGARYYSPELGRFFGMDPATVDPADVHAFNRYAYANNNPYRFVDPDGHSPVDVVFLVYDLGKLGVAAYTGVGVGAAMVDVGLSVVGVASPVPGVGQAFKALRATEHAVVVVKNAHREIASFEKAADYGIKSYKEMKKLTAGTGLEAHHLIEKRFAQTIGVAEKEMQSIALTEAEHQVFTNAWRAKIPYGTGTEAATKADVEAAAKQIYKNYPDILKNLGL